MAVAEIMAKDGLPILFFETQADFESWLDQNHARSKGIWLKLAKKGTGIRSISRQEALDAALCYGWIDGQAKSIDDMHWLQRYTPRRPKSKWSKINCQRAMELEAEGRMKPAGLREVQAAKEDGRWEQAYASPKNIEVPEDLRQMLEERPEAKALFDRLDSRNRYVILYRIHDAKRPETRRKRIEKFVDMLSEGKTIY